MTAPFVCPDCGETGPPQDWLEELAEWIGSHLGRCPGRHGRRPVRRAARYCTVQLSYYYAHLPEWQSHTIRITRKRKVTFHMAELTVRDSDPVATASVALTDSDGHPTTPDQTPAWAEDSNGTVLTLNASADGLSATLHWVAPGTANVTFSVTDNDGTQLVATGTVTVEPGEARQVEMTFTPGEAPAPEPAPDPAPPTP